ncbi:hypothetical protein [Bogoriella caseilytica]|uniref:Uncharacterized protein n=1 Tax=Bogoriella caseilytica TaxID=56055 RepID=A0A3N2BEI1_9MICO|nr:hypothetical protein [Bogoriella caseilytica]ROR73625.1 hypothetical protein EDD31_2012 [Bogoriella caseilytica]
MNTEHTTPLSPATPGTPEGATTELTATGPAETERLPSAPAEDELTTDETPQVWSAANTTPPPVARRVRSGTLVFGIIMTLIGLWAIAAGFGLRLDAQLGTAAILVAAAFGLLIAGLTRRSPAS